MNTAMLTLPGANDFFVQEAYNVLRTNLQFCGKDIHVIDVTSCNENEGKTTIALNIAQKFADLGKRTLFIDADMRKSVITGKYTDIKNPKGLSELLSGMASAQEVLYTTDNKYMNMIFAGTFPPNPVELLSGAFFAKAISVFREKFEYIIIDTPPVGAVIDAAVIATNCDGALLVLGSQKIRYRQAQNAVEQISKSGCKMLGVVRNNVHSHNGRYGYSRYGYVKKGYGNK